MGDLTGAKPPSATPRGMTAHGLHQALLRSSVKTISDESEILQQVERNRKQKATHLLRIRYAIDMNPTDDNLPAIVAALTRGSEHTLLQRRITFALDRIETLLATGWSLPELAAHLAAAGVTQRDGRQLTSGHFAVMVTRARAKGRAAHRQVHSAAHTPTTRPTPPDRIESHAGPGASGIAINLAKIAEKAGRRAAQQEREAATERDIGATLDAMFGKGQAGAPPSPRDAKASASSSLRRPRSRHSR
jgi:hypothetical protein